MSHNCLSVPVNTYIHKYIDNQNRLYVGNYKYLLLGQTKLMSLHKKFFNKYGVIFKIDRYDVELKEMFKKCTV